MLPTILLFAIAVASVDANPALDLNPPSWRGDAYSTTQQWTFPTEDYQPYADAWDNPFGPMRLEILPENPVTYYPYYDPTTGAMKWENLQYLGAFDESQQMMRIETWPNWPDTATNKKAWVQFTWGVHFHDADAPYDRASMLYLSPFVGFSGIFPTPAIDAQVLGIETDFFGNTIEWYHTTFQIPFTSPYIEYDEFGNTIITEENAPWGDMILYPYAGGVFTPEPLTGTYDIYISEVVVDTICQIPEPITAALLACGALALKTRKGQNH